MFEWTVAYCNMKYQKYITVMQMAMGVTASNKDDCIPPKRQLWVPPSSDAATSSGAVPPGVAVSQGKPSLRRIKGRVHRSKSLDSIDLLDCNVSRQITNRTDDVGRTYIIGVRVN
ncbi:hypothetical protein PDJAM_G00151010, partial [Pangasius djambal]|nr:hypothetical protein [Pangasius djambal]